MSEAKNAASEAKAIASDAKSLASQAKSSAMIAANSAAAASKAVERLNQEFSRYSHDDHGVLTANSFNYLRSLVDPEGCPGGVGIPDEFAGDTYKFRTVSEFFLGNGSSSGSSIPFDSSSGIQTVIATPDMQEAQYTYYPVAASGVVLNLGTWAMQDAKSVRRCDLEVNGMPNRSQEQSQSTFSSYISSVFTHSWLPVDYGYSSDYGNTTDPAYVGPNRYLLLSCPDANGNIGIPIKQGHVLRLDAVITGVTYLAQPSNTKIPSYRLRCLVAQTTGAIVSVMGEPTIDGAFSQYLVGATDCRLLGWTVELLFGAYSPNYLSADGTQAFQTATLTLMSNSTAPLWDTVDFGTAIGVPAGMFLRSTPINEYGGFQNSEVRERRLVSMSMWVQYIGSDLYNSGQVVSHCIPDGSPVCQPDYASFKMTGTGATITKVTNYTDLMTLANVPGVHDGKLKDGTYVFWKPNGEGDIAFKDFQERFDWRQPYLVANIYQPTAAGQSIRVRIVRNYECITLSRRFPVTPSPIDLESYCLAFLLISRMPAAMDNFLHFDKIKEFITGAAKKVKELYGKAKKNKVINGAMEAVASAIPGGKVLQNVVDAALS